MSHPRTAPQCHCEERSDEAIPMVVLDYRDCFAALAMTFLQCRC
jgi:hypothetical protein